MALVMEVGIGPGHIVLDADPALPSQKRAHSPQFSAHVYCGQTAEWIKIPLGREVGLGLGHIVLDGAQLLSLKRGTFPPIFRPMSIVAKRSPISATAEHFFNE